MRRELGQTLFIERISAVRKRVRNVGVGWGIGVEIRG